MYFTSILCVSNKFVCKAVVGGVA